MRKSIAGLLLMIAMLVAARPASAEYSGTQTVAQQVFTNQGPATDAVSAIVRNIGQSAHWVVYCVNGSVTSIQVYLESSYNGTSNWNRITDVGTQIGVGCYTLEAGGYYGAVRGHLTSTGTNGVVNAFYSGAAAPISNGNRGNALRNPATWTPFYGNSVSWGNPFVANSSVVNPGAGGELLCLSNTGTPSNRTLYLDKLVISSTVQLTLNITRGDTDVANCTGGSLAGGMNAIQGKSFAGGQVSSGTATVGDSTVPTGPLAMAVIIPANSPVTIDLAGYQVLWLGSLTKFNSLVLTSVGAVTGTVFTNLQWFEQ
jgi:hypothetical protein